MRAKKSSKNLLRISGLALVFMLAVALLVSAISFTRVGAIDNKTAFAAGTYTPGTQELAIGSPSWNWNVPLKADADGNIAVYTYRPNTYKNYFAYVGGICKLREITICRRSVHNKRLKLFRRGNIQKLCTRLRSMRRKRRLILTRTHARKRNCADKQCDCKHKH